MTGSEDDRLEAVREAASDVIASLKKLIDATEQVVHDPDAFSQIVDGGRSVVEAFIDGFTAQADPDAAAAEASDATAEREESGPES